LLPLFKIDLQSYLALTLSLSLDSILSAIFSLGEKHTVDSDSGGFGTGSLVQAETCIEK
jgi:hypothetical protein